MMKGRAARNARRRLPAHFESEEIKQAPHVLVFKRGTAGKSFDRYLIDFYKSSSSVK